MSKATSTNDIMRYQHDDVIGEVSGFTVKIVYEDTKVVTRGNYTWTIQNIYIVDDAGQSIMVKLTDPKIHVSKDVEGRAITLKSTPAKNGNLNGVKFRIDKGRGGKEYPHLWITPSAQIVFDGEASSAPTRSQSTERPAAARQSTASHSAPPAASDANLTAAELTGRFKDVVVLTLKAFEGTDVPENIAHEVAIRSPEYAALWWFGKRSMDFEFQSTDGLVSGAGNWRDFVHPTSKQKLGDLDTGKLMDLVIWSFKNTSESARKKDLYPLWQTLRGPVFQDLGGDAYALLLHFTTENGFSETGMIEYFGQQGIAPEEIMDTDVEKAFSNSKTYLAWLKKNTASDSSDDDDLPE